MLVYRVAQPVLVAHSPQRMGKSQRKKMGKFLLVFGFTVRVLKCSINSLRLLATKLIFTVVFKNQQFVKP